MDSRSALEDIKGLLGHLNEEDLNTLIAEIAYKCNVGIPQWYSASKIKKMAREGYGAELSDADVTEIVQGINDIDPVSVDSVAYTHIELQVEKVKDEPVTSDSISHTETWVQLDD